MTGRRRGLFAVLACALLAYGAILGGEFVYDDLHAVRDNPAIRTLANLPAFFVDVDLFSTECRMYRPVLLVTYALDWAVGGGAVLPFKLTNLVLHAATAAALYLLLLRLGARPRAALLAACLFAAHPLASEAVNTVTGRSETGVTLFLLLALHAHLRARGAPAWTAGTTACALAACGCKEIAVVLPVLLVAVDPPPLRERTGWRAWIARHLPPLAAVAAYLVVRRLLFGQATVAVPQWSGGEEPMAGHGRDLFTQFCTMATLLPRALLQCVVPVGLSLDPPVTFVRSPSAQVIAGAAFVAALVALGLRGTATDPVRRLGMALAVGSALPWILIPLNLPYLEHRMYAPLAGLAAVLAASLPAAGALSASRARTVRALAAALLVAFPVLAARRSLEYHDPGVLWQRLVAAQPASVRGLCGLAQHRIEQGDLAAALPLVQRAIAIWPGHTPALRNLAELHLALAPTRGSVLTALTTADRLVEMAPSDPFHRLLRSRALAAAAEELGEPGWFDDAEREALHCLEIAPPKALVYRTAASARLRQGDHARALALLDAAVAAGFALPRVQLERSDCLRALGRHAEADALARQVIAQNPFDPAVVERLVARGAAPARPPR